MLAAHREGQGGRKSSGKTDTNYTFLIYIILQHLSAGCVQDKSFLRSLEVLGRDCRRQGKVLGLVRGGVLSSGSEPWLAVGAGPCLTYHSLGPFGLLSYFMQIPKLYSQGTVFLNSPVETPREALSLSDVMCLLNSGTTHPPW